MISLDIHHKILKTGNFLSLAGIADLHFLCDTEDKEAFQPLDPEAFNYLKHCFNELEENTLFGKVMAFTGGDNTELERWGDRKKVRAFRLDTSSEDTVQKYILKSHLIPKLKGLIKNKNFIGGVAGNHLIEFFDKKDGENSEQYIIERLGGKYFGDGKALLNFHFDYGYQRCLKKVLILHGTKAGTKQSIIRELQQIFYQYGKIDLVIKCHAHDPMSHFHCKYDLPDSKTGKIKKAETLVMCLGSTRKGEVMGRTDYCERGNYEPFAARFPVAIFHCYKPVENNNTIEIKIRPYIM